MPSPNDELNEKYILLSERILPESDGKFSGFCDELGIATCSDSKEATSRRLSKAVIFLLNTVTEAGEISEFLKDKGIHLFPAEDSGTIAALPPIQPTGQGGWTRLAPRWGITSDVEHRPYVSRGLTMAAR